jgi:modulator of FtsH protease HflC
MQSKIFGIVAAAVAILALMHFGTFTVSEAQLAIRFQFGKIIQTDYKPGLHFMTPGVDNVQKFDRLIITQMYLAERFLTREQEQLNVDFYVKWRIANLRRFYEATGGVQENANARLGERIKDSIKSVVTQRNLQQVVTAERAEFTGAMMKNARPAAASLGVELVDVRITKIDLPSQVRDSVYDRMRSSFKAQAAKSRAEGVEVSNQITADADKQRVEILSNAAKTAAETRGEGDGLASEIYAKSYSQDPEFYSFYRSMQSYKLSIGKENDLLVISPDSAYFKYLNQASLRK